MKNSKNNIFIFNCSNNNKNYNTTIHNMSNTRFLIYWFHATLIKSCHVHVIGLEKCLLVLVLWSFGVQFSTLLTELFDWNFHTCSKCHWVRKMCIYTGARTRDYCSDILPTQLPCRQDHTCSQTQSITHNDHQMSKGEKCTTVHWQTCDAQITVQVLNWSSYLADTVKLFIC